MLTNSFWSNLENSTKAKDVYFEWFKYLLGGPDYGVSRLSRRILKENFLHLQLMRKNWSNEPWEKSIKQLKPSATFPFDWDLFIYLFLSEIGVAGGYIFIFQMLTQNLV